MSADAGAGRGAGAGAGASRQWVLVVDDEVHIRKIIGIKLAQMGFEPVEAKDGAEALDALARGIRSGAPPPAVIVLDIMMPKVDGLSVLRTLRASSDHRGVPVVIVTAVRDREDRAKAEALGVAAIIQKPFRGSDLEAAVERALGRAPEGGGGGDDGGSGRAGGGSGPA